MRARGHRAVRTRPLRTDLDVVGRVGPDHLPLFAGLLRIRLAVRPTPTPTGATCGAQFPELGRQTVLTSAIVRCAVRMSKRAKDVPPYRFQARKCAEQKDLRGSAGLQHVHEYAPG